MQGRAVMVGAALRGGFGIARAGCGGGGTSMRSQQPRIGFSISKMQKMLAAPVGDQGRLRALPDALHQIRSRLSTSAWSDELASITFLLQGIHTDLPDAVRGYAEEKLADAIRAQKSIVREVDVRLSVRGETERGPRLHRCEATLFTKKHGVIRAEEESENIYASIDNAARLLSKKLIKLKKKLGIHGRLRPRARLGIFLEKAVNRSILEEEIEEEETAEIAAETEELVAAENSEIVREKLFEMPPMVAQEAIEHMKNVGHDFYAFRNSATGDINVLYKRKHGGYGLIGPSAGPPMKANLEKNEIHEP